MNQNTNTHFYCPARAGDDRPGPYAKLWNLGYHLNPKVMNPVDPANPLTYSIIPSYNTMFLHGGSISNLNNRTWSRAVQNYMAEYCAGGTDASNPQCPWDGFCEAYRLLNTDTVWANSAVIDTQAYTVTMKFLDYAPTQGEQLVHNTAERRFLRFLSTTSYEEPFDYTVANSPKVRYYSHLYVPGPCIVQNLDNPVLVEKDSVVQKMLEFPSACFDVLTRIYIAYIHKQDGLNITGTRLEQYLIAKQCFLQKTAEMLQQAIPGYDNRKFLWPLPDGGGLSAGMPPSCYQCA